MNCLPDIFEEIYCGRTFYEIVFDKKPFILDWQVNFLEKLIDEIYLPDKFIGIKTITECMIGSVIFFSYEEAKRRLNKIVEE